jgi:hypothetical protein
MFIGIIVSQDVHSARWPIEYALRVQSDQVFARDSVRRQIPRAEHSVAASKGQNTFSGGSGHVFHNVGIS